MILAGTSVDIVNGNPSETIFIIALNYKRFDNWCRSTGLNPRSTKVVYVRDAQSFTGYVNCWVKDLGAPYAKAHEIYNTLEHCKATRGFKEIP